MLIINKVLRRIKKEMDKLQKFEYIQSIESYLEDNQVYELFENLLKQLVIHRPEHPLDFLIQKLSKPERK
jgi:adenylate kinase